MAKNRTLASRAQKGETLAEVLVALLIVALASLLLASMVTVAAHLNTTARQKDEKLYAALGQIERLEGAAKQDDSSTTFYVKIEPDPSTAPWAGTNPVEVEVYASEGLTFYKHKEP